MNIKKILLTTALTPLTALVACSTPPLALTAVPANLSVPSSAKLVLTTFARGVQIYKCQQAADGKFAWAFVAPRADLFDRDGGKIVGKHYAGPHWELPDGSKVSGTVSQRSDAPKPASIPWLLLATKSQGAGLLAGVTYIQRVNTVEGIAPTTPCSAENLGREAQVPYTADYYYFAG